MTAEPRSPEDWTAEEWADLEADLRQLEAEDPAVGEAARSYDETVRRILAQPPEPEDTR